VNTNPLSAALRTTFPIAVIVLLASVPDLALAQASPFLTGANALQANILAWLTPIAIILVITSVHAASAELAFEQLVLLVKQSRAGAELARADIKSLLYQLIDVVIQFGVERHERFIREIWFDPMRKRRELPGPQGG
jgi:hypothetical protein